MDVFTWSLPFVGEKITDMLIAILNCCSKEELDEGESDEEPLEDGAELEEGPDRRKVIKNKILAVGRMARVFALLREESERVSELKNSTGSSTLPSGNLVLGSEAIKDSITGYDDARKSDIENERLPPDLVDPEDARGMLSNPVTPIDETSSPGLEAIDENSALSGGGTSSPGSSGSPAFPSPSSPTVGGGAFRRGHGRQQSLGTTSTSPSTRRRSIENTASLIREAMDDTGPEGHSDLEALADSLSSPGGMNRRRSGSASSDGPPNQAAPADKK